jgi:hypothetical protein
MIGLRIYMDQKKADTYYIPPTFYSRRAGGPYYRWHFETSRGKWLGCRMHTAELASTDLVIASWTGVPDALKSSLSEHYLE